MVGRAVAKGGVAAVEVEVGVEVVGHFQTGFVEGGEGGSLRQQFGFERAPARLDLSVVVGVARPTETGHGPGLRDAGAVSGAGVGVLVTTEYCWRIDFKPLLAESIARKRPDASGLTAPCLTS